MKNSNDIPDPTPSGSSVTPDQQKPALLPRKRRTGWYAVFVIAAFLAGFAPMWLKSLRLTKELDRTNTELRLEKIQFTLADAALDARRGDYEASRGKVSQFFSLLREEQDRSKGSILSNAQRDQFERLSKQRDDLITLLARGDAASVERLAEMYLACRKILAEG